MAYSLFGLMINIWCSCGYLKMLSPWQACKWTFWLIHTLFLLKINLIHRKSLQVKVYTISFTVGMSCGLTHVYCWVKVILTLCISMWFREKNWSIKWWPPKLTHLRKQKYFCGRTATVQRNIPNLASKKKRVICYLWLSTHSWFSWKKLVMLDGTGSNPELQLSSSLVDLLPRMPGWVFLNLSGPISYL